MNLPKYNIIIPIIYKYSIRTRRSERENEYTNRCSIIHPKTNKSISIQGRKDIQAETFRLFLLSLHIAFRIASHPFIFFFDGVQEIDAINISSGRGNKPNPRCVFRTPRNAVDINKKEKINVALLGRPKIKDKSCDMVILCRRCHLLAGRLRWERSYSASRPFFPVPWLRHTPRIRAKHIQRAP